MYKYKYCEVDVGTIFKMGGNIYQKRVEATYRIGFIHNGEFIPNQYWEEVKVNSEAEIEMVKLIPS